MLLQMLNDIGEQYDVEPAEIRHDVVGQAVVNPVVHRSPELSLISHKCLNRLDAHFPARTVQTPMDDVQILSKQHAVLPKATPDIQC